MGILKTLGKGMGYSLIFTLMTLMFTLLTFPEDRLREYIEVLASDATGGRVSIADLSSQGIGGVELTDMALKMPAEKRPEGGDDRPGGMLQVQRLEAGRRALLLLDDVLDVHFSATVQGGRSPAATSSAPRSASGSRSMRSRTFGLGLRVDPQGQEAPIQGGPLEVKRSRWPTGVTCRRSKPS